MSNVLNQEIRKFAATHPVLRHANLRGVERRGLYRCLQRGELVYTAGEQALSVCFLLSGVMQIEYPTLPAKRGRAIAIVTAPGVFGECQTLYQRPWTGSGVALSEVRVLSFDRVAFLGLLGASPALAEHLYKELAWQFLGAIERRRLEPARSPEPVILNYLWDLAETAAKGEGALPFTQAEIGRACGLRRETVSRLFVTLAKKGFLKSARGRVTVGPIPSGVERQSLIAPIHPPFS